MARVGLAIGGAALVLIGGAVAFWGPLSTTQQRTDPVSGVDRVRLGDGSGSVAVRYEPGGRGEITQKVERWGAALWGGGDGEVEHRVEGGELVLANDCGWNCSVSYEVTLPAQVPVEGELGSGGLIVVGMASVQAEVSSGSVELRDIAGPVGVRSSSGGVQVSGTDSPVDVRSSSGSIELADLGGRVEAEAGSGGITGTGLRGAEIVASSGSGSIELELTGPQRAEVSTGSGGIDLVVPADRYRVDTDAGSGGVDVQVPQDPSAAKRLTLSSGSGSISVRS
ncbi:DUF4097 domain-containing protein [Saccharopolyspora indica]|uniref:DUF4097 family beta strand repeat-containing protein n=1 Tax=Saccharopolyspora indica TaxID=1229659 RepID=UPI0022EB4D39|nr:DUF4097 family beta strand repeat-containing protein [Saccharopolyspora indica]MDA3644818.1 DUF4097 family beta strand repeat-containing protein [Saccharopolyspora indica]